MNTHSNIVALHGAGLDARFWRGLADILPLRALDLPGHGGNTDAPLASIEAMAAWTAAQISAPCILMGHSMGALVALHAAARHPMVKGLVLLGAAAEMPVHPDLQKQAHETPVLARDMILKWGTPPHAQAARDELCRIMDKNPTVLGNDLAACDVCKTAPETLAGIKMPVLVIVPSEDRMVRPGNSRALAQALENGHCVELAGAGHMAPVEAPAEMARIIKEFQSGRGF